MKTLIVALFAAILFYTMPVMAQEQLDLSAPDQVKAGTSVYTVSRLTLDWENGYIYISLLGSNGETKTVTYERDAGGPALMKTLNKVDLSTKSLHRRIMEKMVADGHLVGTVSGTPE